MPKEALMPFWQRLETIENYSTVKITQQASKRGKIGCAIIFALFIVIIVLGSITVLWLFAVGFFLVAAAIIILHSWMQKDQDKQ
jgi:ABC-type Fe3+-siderophore transport system permease subunit